MKIYEVIDRTDDDVYLPLGLFLNLDEAVQAIRDKIDPERPISDNQYETGEDVEVIEIKEREIGWCDNGRSVYRLERMLTYSTKSDKYWITKKEEYFE